LRAYNYISLLIVILIICLFVWMCAGNKKYADFFLYLSFLSLFIFSFHLYKLYAKNIPDTIRYVKSEEIKIKYMKDRKDMEVDPYEVPKVFRSEHVLLKYNEVRQGEEPWSVQCILSALRTEKFNKK
jgi:amino acid permease